MPCAPIAASPVSTAAKKKAYGIIFLSPLHLSSLFLSCIFPTLSSCHRSFLSRLSQAPCPHLPRPHPWTNIHHWLGLLQMLAALPLNSPYLIWVGHPLHSWVSWRPSLSWPAQHAAVDCLCSSGVFPLTLGCHGYNQRARLSYVETDAFFSCLCLWFWEECSSVITYCISHISCISPLKRASIFLCVGNAKGSECALLCESVPCSVGRMPGSFGTAQWGDLDRMRGGVKGRVADPQQVLHNCLWHRWAGTHKSVYEMHTLCKYTCMSMHTHTLMQACINARTYRFHNT